jgi:hypothetical protein
MLPLLSFLLYPSILMLFSVALSFCLRGLPACRQAGVFVLSQGSLKQKMESPSPDRTFQLYLVRRRRLFGKRVLELADPGLEAFRFRRLSDPPYQGAPDNDSIGIVSDLFCACRRGDPKPNEQRIAPY